MPKNEKIRVPQFTILVILYTIGTSILISPNIACFFAKNDGWISATINLFIGLLLVIFYTKIAKTLNKKSFLEYMDDTIGTWGGKIVSFLFFIYCFILMAILLREIGDFATIQLYVDTPLDIIIALFILIIIIGTKYGIETIARAGELLFPWFLFLFFILIITLIPEMKTENLFPMYAEGIKPILLSSYASIGVPYLQMFLFLMIIPYVNAVENTGKALFIGVLSGGIIICLITLVSILVLGSESTARLFFPSYTMAKVISIANIIERIEAFLASIWFISIYMKIILTFFCSILFLRHIFKLKETNALVPPLGMSLLFLSIYISPSIIHYKNFVGQIWTPYSAFNGILIPLIIVAVHWFKQRKKGRAPNG